MIFSTPLNKINKKILLTLIFLFGFSFLLPIVGKAATSYTRPCTMSDSNYECKSPSYSCSASSECIIDTCDIASCPAPGPHSSYSSNNCSLSPPGGAACTCGWGVCMGGSFSCSVSGNCIYACNSGWEDANNDPSDGCESPVSPTYTLTVETRTDVLGVPLSGVQITVDGISKSTDSNGITTYSLAPGSHTIQAQSPVSSRPFSHFWDHDANSDCIQTDALDTSSNPYSFNMAACARTITAWYKVFTHFENSAKTVGTIDFDGSKISGYLLREDNQPLHYPGGATVNLSYFDGSSWQPIGSATARSSDGYFEYSWSCVAGATKVKAEFNDTSWFYVSSSGEKGVSCLAICQRNNPTAIASPPSQVGSAGQLKTYTISVKNEDVGAGCGASLFSLTYSCPLGWTCVFTPTNVLTLFPNETGSTTFQATPPSTATPGTYTISIIVTNTTVPPPSPTTPLSVDYIISAAAVEICNNKMDDDGDGLIDCDDPDCVRVPPAPPCPAGDPTCCQCPPNVCQDLFNLVSSLFGRTCASPDYNPIADVNKDKNINVSDLQAVALVCSNGAACQAIWNNTFNPCTAAVEICDNKIDDDGDGKIDCDDPDCAGTPACPCPPEVCQRLLDLVKNQFGKTCSSLDYNPVADVNKDGEINIKDLGEVSNHCGDGVGCQNMLNATSNPCCTVLQNLIGNNFGKECGQTGYNPVLDINKDGVINIKDLQLVSKYINDPQKCQEFWRENSKEGCCKLLQNKISNNFGKKYVDPGFDHIADVNDDCIVNIKDLQAVSKLFTTPEKCEELLKVTVDPCAAPGCGNGKIDAGEECDGFDLGTATCLTIPGNFLGGKLTCKANCTFDTSGCIKPFIKNPCPPELAGGLVPCGRYCDVTSTPEREDCPCTLCHFFVLIERVVKFALFKLVFPLAVLMMAIGGIMFLAAGGSPGLIERGKQIMTFTAIGVGIIFGGWAIINTILMFVGVENWTGLKNWWEINCEVPTVANDPSGVCKIINQQCTISPDGLICTNPDGTKVRDECIDDRHVCDYYCPTATSSFCTCVPKECPSGTPYCVGGICTTTIEKIITESTECEKYVGQFDCESAGCKWCPRCLQEPGPQNVWGEDKCVPYGTDCGYKCIVGKCEAECDTPGLVWPSSGQCYSWAPYCNLEKCKCYYQPIIPQIPCLSGGTLIDTPNGQIPIEEIQKGMLVWTTDRSGNRVLAEVLEISKTPVPVNHWVVHLILDDGRQLSASPQHPTADGRIIQSISVGEELDGAKVIFVSLVPYWQEFTYDILPSGETGSYWANGILLKSTLFK